MLLHCQAKRRVWNDLKSVNLKPIIVSSFHLFYLRGFLRGGVVIPLIFPKVPQSSQNGNPYKFPRVPPLPLVPPPGTRKRTLKNVSNHEAEAKIHPKIIQVSHGPKNPGSLTFHGKSWLVLIGILILMVYEIIPIKLDRISSPNKSP